MKATPTKLRKGFQATEEDDTEPVSSPADAARKRRISRKLAQTPNQASEPTPTPTSRRKPAATPKKSAKKAQTASKRKPAATPAERTAGTGPSKLPSTPVLVPVVEIPIKRRDTGPSTRLVPVVEIPIKRREPAVEIHSRKLKNQPISSPLNPRNQQSSPSPMEEVSFGDLVEENNILKSRIIEFETLDNKLLDIAAMIGEVVFADAAASASKIEEIRKKIALIDSPAGVACEVLLYKLAEATDDYHKARGEEYKYWMRVQELEGTFKSMGGNDTVAALRKAADKYKKAFETQEMQLVGKIALVRAMVKANKRFGEMQEMHTAAIWHLSTDYKVGAEKGVERPGELWAWRRPEVMKILGLNNYLGVFGPDGKKFDWSTADGLTRAQAETAAAGFGELTVGMAHSFELGDQNRIAETGGQETGQAGGQAGRQETTGGSNTVSTEKIPVMEGEGDSSEIRDLQAQLAEMRQLTSCDELREKDKDNEKEIARLKAKVKKLKELDEKNRQWGTGWIEKADNLEAVIKNLKAQHSIEVAKLDQEKEELYQRLRAKSMRAGRQSLFTDPGSLDMTSISDVLKRDALPPIQDINDEWFAAQWDELYHQVMIFCTINCNATDDSIRYEWSRDKEDLLSIYIGDVVLDNACLVKHINMQRVLHGHTYRTKVAAGIVFRILVEEIFNPIRYLLNLRFQDPAERWKTKSQYQIAFQGLIPPTNPTYQDKSSWVSRKRRHQDQDSSNSKRQRSSFNFFKEIENKDYSNGNDADAVILNTVRAKMMRAIFDAVDDRAVYDRYQEIRATVSELIRDTLHPFRHKKADKSELKRNAQKRAIHKIIKQAFNLAISMRTQRTIIYADLGNELLSMNYFNSASMTDIEQEEFVTDENRQRHDDELSASAYVEGIMEKYGKVQAMVQPALMRKGSYINGNFTDDNITVISKAKVIVGKTRDSPPYKIPVPSVRRPRYSRAAPTVASGSGTAP